MTLIDIAKKRGQIERAREYYLAAIQSNPSLSEPYVALGNLEMRNKSYDNAAEQFAKAIERGDNKIEIHYNRVLALILDRRYHGAKEALKNAYKVHPLSEQLNDLLYRLAKEAKSINSDSR